jgi:hypothetical protein
MPDDLRTQLAAQPTRAHYALLALLIAVVFCAILLPNADTVLDSPIYRTFAVCLFASMSAISIYYHPRYASIGALLGVAVALLLHVPLRPSFEWHWRIVEDCVRFAMYGALIGAARSSFKKSASVEKATEQSP